MNKYKNTSNTTLAIRDKYGNIEIVGPEETVFLERNPKMKEVVEYSDFIEEIIKAEEVVDKLEDTPSKKKPKKKKGEKYN